LKVLRFYFRYGRNRGRGTEQMKGLVVSSDDEVRRKLAEMLRQRGLAPVFASTVAESRTRLSRSPVQIVICEDWLGDGKYDAVVRITNQINAGAPVIVFSRTGDWLEYLTAMRTGVFDYLAYPPFPGEFERTLQNALRECAGR
jgi:DNA-binding NtrC family response regulator